MGWKRNAALIVVGAVVLTAAVVIYRTESYEPPAAVDLAAVKVAPDVTVDAAKAAAHLGEAVRFKTISNQNPADNDWTQWDALHAWLQATYPAAHAAMTREVVAGHGLVYTWTGSDPSLAPIVLMAHQDVVPVTPGTEGDWTHPPFDGVVADDAVWGRGSIDDKGSLVTLFEAAENLATSGFKPRRTVIIVSGHDEERGGTGAQAAAALIKSRGMTAEWALDEGLAVIDNFPMVDAPVALVGVGEKGYATLQITARAVGGHSSAPPKETGVETLAKAVLAITGKPYPMRFEGPGAETVKAIAPKAGYVARMAAANGWLFGPLLVKQISATPAGASTLHTTIAPTMLKGSPKENVLPQDATAWINYRIMPGQTRESVMADAKRAVGDLPVELSWGVEGGNPSPVSSTSSDGWKVIAALASDDGRLTVAPGLVTAATDSRYMTGVAKDVYRFQPIIASIDDFAMIHGTDEHITVGNLERMVRFYQRLIQTAAS